MSDGQPMLHSDAFAWYMERDPVLRSTVVGVARFESEPDWDTLRTRIDSLSRRVQQLRMRVQSPWLRVGPPRWVVDDHFDLNYHLRRLGVPAGAGWDDVLEFARTAAMADFDRARPLWEFTLLTGLSDGGAALVTKLHHSLTDGIGGMQLAALVFDGGHRTGRVDGPTTASKAHRPSTLEITARSLTDGLRDVVGVIGRAARSAPGDALEALHHPYHEIQSRIRTTVSIGRFVAPAAASTSQIDQRDIGRRLATLDLPLAALHAAARAAGCHLNDAYLAALLRGVRTYREHHGGSIKHLHVTVPVSIRRRRDAIGGNRITLTRITLRADIDDPVELMRHIAAVVRDWREAPALAYTQQIALGLNVVPRAYLNQVFKRMDLVASDVPGIPDTARLAGARLVGYYGFGPTIGAAFNTTLVSYDGTCNVGINIDTSAVPDPDRLIECIREGFAEVVEVGAERVSSERFDSLA